jgi:hypothetical protein
MTEAICSGREARCTKANHGLGCCHRKSHEYTNDCKVMMATDTGKTYCRVVSGYVACEAKDESWLS